MYTQYPPKKQEESRPLYTQYIPKTQGKPLPFLITEVLKLFTTLRMHQDNIIAAPGYMSTTTNTLNTFVEKFGETIASSGKKQIYYGVSNGMNGNCKMSDTTDKTSARMETEIRSSKYFTFLDVDWNKKRDHRKMLFLFTFKDKQCFTQKLNKNTLDTFLAMVEVHAIMVGSSNQSKRTFFDKTADKGESDIFMFKDELYKRVLTEYTSPDIRVSIENYKIDINSIRNIANNTVLSSSISMPKDIKTDAILTPDEFFKNILKDFLQSSLN